MDSTKRYFWLKLKTDFFNQREIKKLRKIAGGDTFTIIYLKMQLLSVKSGGVIKFEGTEEHLDEQLSIELDEELENVRMTLSLLEKINLVYYVGNDLKVLKIQSNRNRSTEQYRNWRNEVFKRDNYTCLKCKVKGSKLNAHHVKSWANYPNLRFDVSNGITLCVKCHKYIHKRGE